MAELKNDNIVKFKKKSVGLSDNDIQNLFMGFVSLLKRKAISDVSFENERKILQLKKEIKRLQEEKTILQEQLSLLQQTKN